MRKLLGLSLAVFLLVGFAASQANAANLAWKGTIRVDINTFPPAPLTGTGVFTVNNSAGGSHLNTMQFTTPGITGTIVVPITDPEVTGIGLLAVKLTINSQLAGTFANLSTTGALSQNQRGTNGAARLCLFFQGCVSAFLPVNLSANNGMTGAGIGGAATIGGFGTIRVSLVYNPWTKGTTTLTNLGTDDGGVTTRTRMGFQHGAQSGISSTAQTSGVVQLVNATSTVTAGIPTGGAPNAKGNAFTIFTIHVIPEPGLLLLLGSGVVGLALLGHRRIRK